MSKCCVSLKKLATREDEEVTLAPDEVEGNGEEDQIVMEAVGNIESSVDNMVDVVSTMVGDKENGVLDDSNTVDNEVEEFEKLMVSEYKDGDGEQEKVDFEAGGNAETGVDNMVDIMSMSTEGMTVEDEENGSGSKSVSSVNSFRRVLLGSLKNEQGEEDMADSDVGVGSTEKQKMSDEVSVTPLTAHPESEDYLQCLHYGPDFRTLVNYIITTSSTVFSVISLKYIQFEQEKAMMIQSKSIVYQSPDLVRITWK